MGHHEKYGLKKVINAWGTPTLYGVSRAPEVVADAVTEALGELYHMPSLERIVGERVAEMLGAPAACVTHCTAAAVTLACAAAMTGKDLGRIKRLPLTDGLANKVLIQAGHRVNYGADISQAIALSGACEAPVGAVNKCTPDQMELELRDGGVAAVIFVASHLAVSQGAMSLSDVVGMGREYGVPVIVDAAAQDLRLPELLASGADFILISAQKYLRAPTAGLVLGRPDLVAALAAQHVGIGRGMKPTKEALLGVLAAVELRHKEGIDQWAATRRDKVEALAQRLSQLEGLEVSLIPDPTGCPFSRIRITPRKISAAQLAKKLAQGDPIVATGAHYAALGYLHLETLELTSAEEDALVEAISRNLS